MERAGLITGGSSGIGLAIARALKDEGFALTLAARTRERLETAAADLGAHAVVANVADPADCALVVEEHRERHGRLDVLVNSAGVGIGGTIDQLSAKQVSVQLDVNLRGLMLVTSAALPLLREARGLIVNLASIAGTMGTPPLPVYGAAKAGVIQFTNSLNRGEQDHGVRATAISPGFVDTPMTDWNPVPKDQMIRPQDCAEVVRMLLRLSPYARIPHLVIERIGS
jgi:NAD(P)-dependent dehydrogenase (short-subunit alcohol dehydrogenase family)